MRHAVAMCALAVASGGCAADGKDEGGVEPSLPGVVLITPWLENSSCNKSPYGRAFRADIIPEVFEGVYLATFEAWLDDPVAIGLPPGAFVFFLRGGWEADGPKEPGCDNACGCYGTSEFSIDQGEVLELAVAVHCSSGGCEE